MPTLELKNVSYAYEKGKAVLQNVSGLLETGKMYAILGPSGSGKTTLLSLLGGLDVPTQGGVLFDGEDITARGLEHHRRNHISLIFQSYNLIDYMTPVENVRLTAKLDADTAEEITAILKESAHVLGKCVVVVTHDREVAKQADVVLEIKRGHLGERNEYFALRELSIFL